MIPDPRIGTVVGRKYRIVEEIGRGGMGAVYRATHLDLGEPVAVKFLHGIYAADRELFLRFRREAVVLARLRHPGIVSLLDVSAAEDEPFFVMELVSGNSLRAELARERGGLPMPRLGDIFGQLLEVLALAHERGIVHRDTKPSNVMVVTGDLIKLLDFGLVHLPESAERLTATGVPVGTPEYMSPEQCDGAIVGPPTDVYAVGVMLFEALTGTLPFEGNGAGALMASHLFLEAPTLAERSLGRTISASFEKLVGRMLSKSPLARPTARETRHELISILKGSDAVMLAEQVAQERLRFGALSRSERAIPGSQLEAPSASSTHGLVLLAALDPARRPAIRSALAVAGFSTRPIDRAAPRAAEASAPSAIVVPWDEERADEEPLSWLALAHPGVPILVIDVDGAHAAARVIRAGASDMTLAGAPCSELARRVARLTRRGR